MLFLVAQGEGYILGCGRLIGRRCRGNGEDVATPLHASARRAGLSRERTSDGRDEEEVYFFLASNLATWRSPCQSSPSCAPMSCLADSIAAASLEQSRFVDLTWPSFPMI